MKLCADPSWILEPELANLRLAYTFVTSPFGKQKIVWVS